MKATIVALNNTYSITPQVNAYANGGVRIDLRDSETYEPICTLSVWVPETPDLPRGAFYCKHWSENQGIVEQLLQQGVLEPVMATPVRSGFIENIQAYRLRDIEDQRNV
jgi:hypothetical protein